MDWRNIYDFVHDFFDGLASVKLNGKWGFIDKTGKEIVPCKYDWVGSFSELLTMVKLNGQWGYIDKTGKEICPIKYDYVYDFNKDLPELN